MPAYVIVLTVLALLIIGGILAVVVNDQMAKRKDPHGPVITKKREAIRARVNAVDKKASEMGIEKVDTPDGDDFQKTLFECKSLLRDGRRSLDKVSMKTDLLEKQFAELEKEHAAK